MGSLFGSKQTTTSNQKSDSGPSSFQKPYLDTLFQGAQQNYQNSQGTPYYQGPTYAGITQGAQGNLEALKGFASGTGLSAAGTMTGIGTQLSGAAGQALGAQNAYAAQAGQDGTSEILGNAARYASSPYLDGQIDAVNRDVGRGLREETLPGIDRQASATGGINSSRAGIAAGVAMRGAGDRMADNASSMRSQAYGQGLGMAQSDYNSRMGRLGGLAEGYSGLAGQGLQALQGGTSMGYGAYGAITGADQAQQQDTQGAYTNAEKQWQNQDTRSFDLLKRYQDTVGSQQWGQSGTSSGTQTQSQSTGLGSSLLGLASTGLGLAGGMGWKPFGK